MWMRDSTHSSPNVNQRYGSRTNTLAATELRLGRCVFTRIPFQLKVKQFHLNTSVEDCTSFRPLDEDGGVSAFSKPRHVPQLSL